MENPGSTMQWLASVFHITLTQTSPSEASCLHCNPTQPPFPSLILALQAKIETASVSIVTAGATVTLSGPVAHCVGFAVLEGRQYTTRTGFI
jgi:hypothetical protein